MNTKTLIFETENLLEAERQIQEETENARIKTKMGQELQARRRLFTQREPSAAQILTAAFLDNEIECTEADENARLEWIRQRQRFSEREYCNRPLEQYKYDHNGEFSFRKSEKIRWIMQLCKTWSISGSLVFFVLNRWRLIRETRFTCKTSLPR